MVSICWYMGYLKGWLGGAGRLPILSSLGHWAITLDFFGGPGGSWNGKLEYWVSVPSPKQLPL